MISSLHRPTKAVIDLKAIQSNIKSVQAHMPSGKQTFAVVKADAYGHGAVQVAQAVEVLVDGFCVSNVDEAIELREAAIKKPILILGIVMPEELALVKQYDLITTVAGLEWLELAQKQQSALKGLQVHVKVDSGMGRIGVRSSDEANQLIAGLQESGAIVSGIYTHFATADETDDRQFNEQLSFFINLLEQLAYKPEMVHASNSATALWHSETIFNAVRLGIIIYGLNPSGCTLDLPYEVKPALSLESALIHVKNLETGQSIGYGATYKTTGNQFIGTVPIGYADGWTRDLQGFSVLVNGKACQIVGRVSMDQITIRLPEKSPLGTKVTLIGRDGPEVITATAIADKRGTINYEVLCLISDRVPREYK